VMNFLEKSTVFVVDRITGLIGVKRRFLKKRTAMKIRIQAGGGRKVDWRALEIERTIDSITSAPSSLDLFVVVLLLQ